MIFIVFELRFIVLYDWFLFEDCGLEFLIFFSNNLMLKELENVIMYL